MARVDRMVAEFAVEAEWVPFELHPETPAEGKSREELGRNYPAGYRERLYGLAEAVGLPMQTNHMVSNGHKPLEAAEWAREQSRETFDGVHRAIFDAYFARSKNVSTIDQVVELVQTYDDGALKLDGDGLRKALETGAYHSRVDELTQLARTNGISSTPTFIFEDQFVVPGAQDYAVFEDVLTRLGVPRREGFEPPADRDPALDGEPVIAPGNFD